MLNSERLKVRCMNVLKQNKALRQTKLVTNMKDCRNCENLEYTPYVRQCDVNQDLHEKWWHYINTTSDTDKEIEEKFEGLMPFWCWKEKCKENTCKCQEDFLY